MNLYGDNCDLEIWAPGHRSHFENTVFSAYCFHSQEIEDVINLIGSGAPSIQCDDDMSEADMRYIENEVRSRYGLDISLS